MSAATSVQGELVVPARFCGPARSGNGGWSAGALAAHVTPGPPPHPAISVSLRRPPPLDTVMEVLVRDGLTVASLDGSDVLRGSVVEVDLALVQPVPADEARAAQATYAGLTSHPFPTCFACGTERAVGDGLRIFPGRVGDVAGAPRQAATWTPDPSLSEDWHAYRGAVREASLPVTWAALDCIGGWAGDLGERAMVLATMTARVDRLPVIGEEHVVVGLARGDQGRKTFTAATLYDAAGDVVATAEHGWVAVDPAAFN